MRKAIHARWLADVRSSRNAAEAYPEFRQAITPGERNIRNIDPKKLTQRCPSLGDVEDEQPVGWDDCADVGRAPVKGGKCFVPVAKLLGECLPADDLVSRVQHVADMR